MRLDRSMIGLAVLLSIGGSTHVIAGGSPNFVFILSDDQSWCGTSALVDPAEPRSRSDYYRTPNLERLAAMGMRFSNGYSPAPFCCPTRRSLQIGQFPARHFFKANQREVTPYYQKQRTIPQVLKQINPNYKTAHFGKWDFRSAALSPEVIGYDESDGPTNNSQGGSRDSGGPAAAEDPKLIDDITWKGCDFIENCLVDDTPFYVQVSHWAVHLDVFYKQATYDRVSKRPKGQRHSMTGFAAMTEDMDAGIGRILDKIQAVTLVILQRNLLFAMFSVVLATNGSVLCRHAVADEETSSRLLFRTGFEEDVEHVGERKSGDGAITRLKGKDRQTGCDAADLGSLIPGIKDFYIAYNCGRPHVDSTSTLVDAPEPGHGRVLKFQVNSDDGEKYNARTACSFYLDPDKFKQLGVRYDFKIDASFVDFPATQQSWWVMSEIWVRQYPKEGKVSLPIYLRLRGDKAVFSSVVQRRASNSWRILPPDDAPVIPIGQWVTIDMFLKPGPAGTGRFYLACNGRVVFDVADKDIGKNDFKMSLWSVIKLYLDLSIVDGMRERGTPASVYYDNFEIWSGVPNRSFSSSYHFRGRR